MKYNLAMREISSTSSINTIYANDSNSPNRALINANACQFGALLLNGLAAPADVAAGQVQGDWWTCPFVASSRSHGRQPVEAAGSGSAHDLQRKFARQPNFLGVNFRICPHSARSAESKAAARARHVIADESRPA